MAPEQNLVTHDFKYLAPISTFVCPMLNSLGMSYANITHSPDVDLPDQADYDCPPDCLSLIEEWHQGLHSIVISKQTGRSKYKPIGKIDCQKKGDRHSRPEATPDELGEYIMRWIQYEIEETDDPGNYRFMLNGPPGKGRFNKSKHIDLRDEDGIARSKDMLSEGDMLEQQSAYIGELHSQLTGMIDLVLGSYKVVVGENREMMKILSEATRKHGEIEANRLAHQLNMKMHEDEMAAQDAEAERSMQKFREGLNVFKETQAAEELIRALAKKIKGKEEKGGSAAGAPNPQSTPEPVAAPATSPAPAPKASPSQSPFHRPGIAQGELTRSEDQSAEARTTSKKKSGKKAPKKKTTKKKRGKLKKGAKSAETETPPEPEHEEPIDEDILEEGRRMVMERPLVTAAEALKMSINQKSQWGLLRKELNGGQLDILDEIFAATTDDAVKELAQKLYDAPGLLKLAGLQKHLDDQQQGLISLVMSEVQQ